MKEFTEVAETLGYIVQITKKLDSFSKKFKSDNEHWTDQKKQLIQGRENTKDRLKKIREGEVSAPDDLITDDNENLKNIDFIVSGYDKIMSDNEEFIKYIEHFKKNDLTKKHKEILSKEDYSWMEDTSPSPSKRKKKGKKKGGMNNTIVCGKKTKIKTKRKTKKRKTKRKNHKKKIDV
tara:strand:+ start:225 stop:758 length:534 start_codon:yes stop_codon:yes gene_type:complete